MKIKLLCFELTNISDEQLLRLEKLDRISSLKLELENFKWKERGLISFS